MKNILIIGGSGHVSGAVARCAVSSGYRVYTVTRGARPAVDNSIIQLHADRHDPEAVKKLCQQIAGTTFEAVIDCICYNAGDMQQTLELFAVQSKEVLFISTDWVYEASLRKFPQSVENAAYLTDDHGGLEAYGWGKLMAENYLRENAPATCKYTIFRPCHIYGMPSELGCFPEHCRDKELIARLLRGETLQLVDNGRLLQQPIAADDLAKTIISAVGNSRSSGRAFNMAGPDIVESREYYQIIADALNVPLKTADADYDEYLKANPGHRPFLCHRVYRLDDLQNAGLYVPATPLREGLKEHTLALRKKLEL